VVKKTYKNTKKAVLLTAAIVILALCIAYLLPATQTSEPGISQLNVTAPVVDEAVETPVSASQRTAHKVAPNQPRYLTIDKFDVRARVLSVGASADRTIGAPKSIHDVGWYRGSAKPGQAGVMFLDGHVSGPTQPGVFKQIGSLKNGDKIGIERGDGIKFRYVVTSVKLVPEDKVDMNSLLVSPDAYGEHLVLMTCGGSFNRAENQYEGRVIVQAKGTDTP